MARKTKARNQGQNQGQPANTRISAVGRRGRAPSHDPEVWAASVHTGRSLRLRFTFGTHGAGDAGGGIGINEFALTSDDARQLAAVLLTGAELGETESAGQCLLVVSQGDQLGVAQPVAHSTRSLLDDARKRCGAAL